MLSPSKTILTATLLLAAWSVVAVAYAQTAWHEGFETSQPSWHYAGSNAQYRVVQHRRLQGQAAHTGNGCERLRVECGGGVHVYVAHDIGRPRVIEELSPSVWIKSDRPGLQLAARVVLPRTVDPRTGQAMTTIVLGDRYGQVGRWQQLRIEGIPRLLTRRVRVLRLQLGPQVDDREAYLDAVLLNVCGGPGATNVWIDDLEVAGHAATGSTSMSHLVPVRLPPVQPSEAEAASAIRTVPPPRRAVKLVGSVLLVDDRPMFPRVIQHCGEPLAALKKIGFNAVWLQRLPAPELLEEANRLGLWLICPPPRPAAASQSNLTEIGPQFDCVLAWDLGDDLTETELESTRRWAEQVRAADRRGNRPLVCRPRTDLRSYSRLANLLLIDRRPLGTSLDMADYAAWVRRQPLLASLGTPVWTTVQTQPNEALRQQLAVLEPGYVPPLVVSSEQVRLLVYTAVAAGSRGLVFASDSPLDSPDPDTRQRAMTLELLNLELELMEPWAAAGSFVATAKSNVPEVSGTVLRTNRARLLLPLWFAPGAQCVPVQPTVGALTLLAPGVPEATAAYELTPNGLRPLRHKRVAGGVSVTLDEFALSAQILLAHDPLIISAVHRRAARMGRRAAELWRNLAAHKLSVVQALAGRLASRTSAVPSAALLEAARRSLQSCNGQSDAFAAVLDAQRAMRSLQLVERAYWDAAVKGLASPVTSPAALGFDTLPCHWRLLDRLAAGRFGPNLLGGGDFEDLGTMLRAGWRYVPHSTPTVRTAVDLAPQAAHGGRLGVRLTVAAVDPKNPPAVIETPPILFTSPTVEVEAGRIVCIHGWAQVPTAPAGTADGLLVVDSLSGECLADRIGQTSGWRQFALYRAAPRSGPMCVTFALTGPGEAWLDDVEIQVLQGPSAMTQR